MFGHKPFTYVQPIVRADGVWASSSKGTDMRISRTALLATTLLSGVAFANPAFAQTAPANNPPPANPQAQPELNSAATDQTPATQENPADTVGQTRQDTEKGSPE